MSVTMIKRMYTTDDVRDLARGFWGAGYYPESFDDYFPSVSRETEPRFLYNDVADSFAEWGNDLITVYEKWQRATLDTTAIVEFCLPRMCSLIDKMKAETNGDN